MNEGNTYFLIKDKYVGKCRDGKYFVFESGKWLPDTKYVIMDRLLGFDESEPLDSPYRMGSTSVMDEIEVIPSERVDELTGGQL